MRVGLCTRVCVWLWLRTTVKTYTVMFQSRKFHMIQVKNELFSFIYLRYFICSMNLLEIIFLWSCLHSRLFWGYIQKCLNFKVREDSTENCNFLQQKCTVACYHPHKFASSYLQLIYLMWFSLQVAPIAALSAVCPKQTSLKHEKWIKIHKTWKLLPIVVQSSRFLFI